MAGRCQICQTVLNSSEAQQHRSAHPVEQQIKVSERQNKKTLHFLSMNKIIKKGRISREVTVTMAAAASGSVRGCSSFLTLVAKIIASGLVQGSYELRRTLWERMMLHRFYNDSEETAPSM